MRGAARHQVVLTRGAEHDLAALHVHIAGQDGSERADRVLEQLLGVAESLVQQPERGSVPRELLALGMHEYRQVFFKPWRIIHRVVGERVVIFVIADGRRDMQSLLARRVLGA